MKRLQKVERSTGANAPVEKRDPGETIGSAGAAEVLARMRRCSKMPCA